MIDQLLEKSGRARAEQIKLDPAQKAAMRNSLVSLMRREPLPAAPAGLHFMPRWASAALALAIIFGGAAAAAEGSLPGDWLYPVKIQVNERLVGVLTVGSPAGGGQWQVNLAHRRLQEAESLAAAGELAPATSRHLAVAAKKHLAAAKIKAESAEQVKAAIISTLNNHALIINELTPVTAAEVVRPLIDLLEEETEKTLVAPIEPIKPGFNKTIDAAASQPKTPASIKINSERSFESLQPEIAQPFED